VPIVASECGDKVSRLARLKSMATMVEILMPSKILLRWRRRGKSKGRFGVGKDLVPYLY